MSINQNDPGIYRSKTPIVLSGDTVVNSPIYVGGAGDVVQRADQDTDFHTVPYGDHQYVPGYIAEIRETGTTATSLFSVKGFTGSLNE